MHLTSCFAGATLHLLLLCRKVVSVQDSPAAMSGQVYTTIASILGDCSLDEHPSARLRLHGNVPVFYSRHKLTVSAASAIGSYALAVEKWWHLATGRHQSVAIGWMQAAASLNPGQFQKQNGYALPALDMVTELRAGFYRTQDGKWFYATGSYPHLRDGVLDLLQCANTSVALGKSIEKWSAQALEDAFGERKLTGNFARTRQEWAQHPQGMLLSRSPLVEVERIGDSDAEVPVLLKRPLDRLRVLDMGHVLAGPVVARTLAEHGADVLRLTDPMNQDAFRQTVDSNIGKRSAFIDLNRAVDLQRTRELLSSADVLVQSWRKGSLAAKGLGPQDAARIRPGIIYVSVTAFGDEGPWATRGGFEQLGQVVSGIAIDEGGADCPRLVVTTLLNDYLTGYLGAAGVMLALIKRATVGGSYHVKVSLARTSMWVQSLGLVDLPDLKIEDRHFARFLDPVLESRDSAYGKLEQLPPVAQFSRTPPRWALPPAPNGAHVAGWMDVV